MRDRVVHVHEIELLALGDFVLLDRERERIRRRLLEERVLELGDFVKRDALGKSTQPEWIRVGDEVDFVPAARKLEPQLRCNGARAAVGRRSEEHTSELQS